MIDLYNGDCIEIMDKLINKNVKVDAIICDPPYGTTACKWDSIIPFDDMWRCINALIKDKGAIVLFGSQPFTTKLINSNIVNFKYEWIWQKAVGSNFALLKYQPMKEHENILVFSNGTHNYYPVKQKRAGKGSDRLKYDMNSSTTGDAVGKIKYDGKKAGYYDINLRNPSSVQYFNNRESTRGLHPTQKPVSLMEYLVKTYTKENQTVLDFTMGSGSTGIACLNTNRNFIGIELDEKYFNIASDRINSHIPTVKKDKNRKKLF